MNMIAPDRLTLLGRLSKGSYAVVDLAELRKEGAGEHAKGKKVAIKRLRTSAFTERDVTCFAREAELLLSIEDHPSIPKLIGIGCDESREEMRWPSMFLVLEYASGGTLQHLLSKQMEDPRVTLYTYNEAIRWARQIGSAVLELHHRKPMVIHRDVRAENVLLYEDPPGKGHLVAKLGDLGMHRVLSKGSKLHFDPNDTLNATDETGNFCYLPPEVLRQEPYDEKVDIFGFGVILYELFMRRSLVHYFESQDKTVRTAAPEYAKQMEGGYRMPLADKLPTQLKKLIESCMAGDPAERPNISAALVILSAVEESGGLKRAEVALPGCACSLM